ncbi:hypothetical protein EWF20_01300 [Sulfolobus sp. S-194]|uniref:SRPBCC domain-containing protein n=1 Tax=Sulfolobus sp. S-194 TaxID=2512240 RepID=UPI0014370D79|nr:SRPBCC domain-containing protein [Sulfolobus sp. S-194]QIW22924.1 hypothetical protein EWF20_01300 [Sulfolobus sp. S-194]
MSIEGGFHASRDVKKFFENYQNFISCIPNVKNITDKRFKLDAQVGGFSVTADGELVSFKQSGDTYEYEIKINGPGVTINIRTVYKLQNNEISWTSHYNYEGFAVSMVGSLLDTTIQNMVKATNECIRSKLE